MAEEVSEGAQHDAAAATAAGAEGGPAEGSAAAAAAAAVEEVQGSGKAAEEEEEGEEAAEGEGGGLEGAESQQRNEKDLGNEAYERGEYEAALKAWNRSLMSVRYILNKGFYNHNAAQLQEVKGMEVRLCLNLSQGYLKTRDWSSAIAQADKVLALDPSNAKALYRKASALEQQQSYREATAVLEQWLQLEPQNKAALKMAAETKRNAKLSERKAKLVSERMFSALSEERDPRVPPTRREALVGLLRGALAEALRGVRALPRRCQDLALLSRARALATSLWRWLGGLLRRKRD